MLKLLVAPAIIVSFLACGSFTKAGEYAPYPIWWSPSLELESLDMIDERLKKKFWPDREGGIPVYKGEWPGESDAFVDSCDSFNKLKSEGYYARSNLDVKSLYKRVTTCFILEELRQAKPSPTSYVEDIKLSPELLNYLPAMVNPAASCDFLCRQHVANERRIPWSKFEVMRFLNVKVDHEHRMEVLTESKHLNLEIMARADFNDDGVQETHHFELRQAKPSPTSYVEDIKLSPELLNYLPAMVNPAASCDFLCRQHVANERRIPWSKFEVMRFLNVKVDHEHRMEVLTESKHLNLEIMARADFNDDGVQDLLLWVHAGATEGRGGTTTFFKLSRGASDDVLHVLNADDYLCSIETYHPCDESYDYPSILQEAN